MWHEGIEKNEGTDSEWIETERIYMNELKRMNWNECNVISNKKIEADGNEMEELEMKELKWSWIEMQELKRINQNEWIEVNELKWINWNEGIDNEGIDMKEVKWMIWKEWIETNELKRMT